MSQRLRGHESTLGRLFTGKTHAPSCRPWTDTAEQTPQTHRGCSLLEEAGAITKSMMFLVSGLPHKSGMTRPSGVRGHGGPGVPQRAPSCRATPMGTVLDQTRRHHVVASWTPSSGSFPARPPARASDRPRARTMGQIRRKADEPLWVWSPPCRLENVGVWLFRGGSLGIRISVGARGSHSDRNWCRRHDMLRGSRL